MPKLQAVRFKNPSQNLFAKTLKERVDDYFKAHQLSKSGGAAMWIKALVMFSIYFVPYFLLMAGVIEGLFWQWLLTFAMGVGMAGIGLSVMHDANHGTFSKNKRLNKLMGASIYLLGGNVNSWKIQHNVLHHSFTNIEGYDEDIDPVGILRFSPHAPKRKIHRFQHIYAWFLYGLMTISWTFVKDTLSAKKYADLGLLKTQNSSLRKELMVIILSRLFYFAYMIVLPLLIMDVTFWQWLVGFLTVHFVCGLFLAAVFQSAHVMETTDFPVPEPGPQVESQWAVHQMATTSNFATKSRWFTWFIGGLNYQVEHHLFPHISHVHYRKIAPIVQRTAREFNIPYFNESTFLSALMSHGRMLYSLGN